MASPQRKMDDKDAAQEAVAKRQLPESASAHSGKVLIVEDEPEILEPLAHSLQKAGFTVLRAEDGLTACRIIGSERPDLVLLDIMLPDLDGWEVCRLLRQHPDPLLANTPVAMLTALGGAEDKYRGLEIGADLYLPKPYSIREVILHAGNLVRRRQQSLALEARVKAMSKSKEASPDIHHLLFHELRNQLLILNGYTELLQKDPGGKRAGICMDAICRSSNYLQTLAEEVLLIRQVEDGRVSLECKEFPLAPLIDDLITVYQTAAREKGVLLRYQSTDGAPHGQTQSTGGENHPLRADRQQPQIRAGGADRHGVLPADRRIHQPAGGRPGPRHPPGGAGEDFRTLLPHRRRYGETPGSRAWPARGARSGQSAGW